MIIFGAILAHASSVMKPFSVITRVEPAAAPCFIKKSSSKPGLLRWPAIKNAQGPFPATLPVRYMVMDMRESSFRFSCFFFCLYTYTL